MHNARLADRAPFAAEVDVLKAGSPGPERLWGGDVSEAGMFLHGVAGLVPFRVGDRLSLRFDVDDFEVHVRSAEVMWVAPRDAAAVRKPGVGVRFVAIDPPARAALRRFVRPRAGARPTTTMPTTDAWFAPPEGSLVPSAPPAARGALDDTQEFLGSDVKAAITDAISLLPFTQPPFTQPRRHADTSLPLEVSTPPSAGAATWPSSLLAAHNAALAGVPRPVTMIPRPLPPPDNGVDAHRPATDARAYAAAPDVDAAAHVNDSDDVEFDLDDDVETMSTSATSEGPLDGWRFRTAQSLPPAQAASMIPELSKPFGDSGPTLMSSTSTAANDSFGPTSLGSTPPTLHEPSMLDAASVGGHAARLGTGAISDLPFAADRRRAGERGRSTKSWWAAALLGAGAVAGVLAGVVPVLSRAELPAAHQRRPVDASGPMASAAQARGSATSSTITAEPTRTGVAPEVVAATSMPAATTAATTAAGPASAASTGAGLTTTTATVTVHTTPPGGARDAGPRDVDDAEAALGVRAAVSTGPAKEALVSVARTSSPTPAKAPASTTIKRGPVEVGDGRIALQLGGAPHVKRTFALAAPARLVVDLKGATLPGKAIDVEGGGVAAVKFGTPDAKTQRVVVVLDGDAKTKAPIARMQGGRLVIRYQR